MYIYIYTYSDIRRVTSRFCRFVAWHQLSSIARNKVSFAMYQRQRDLSGALFELLLLSLS